MEDGAAAGPGQADRTTFLDALRLELVQMVDEEMAGTGWSGEACPYIDHYIERYRGRVFSQWQTLANQWLASTHPTDVDEVRAAVTERVRRGLREWRQRGTTPLPPDGEAAPRPLRWAMPGARPVTPEAARAAAQLGPGSPLPADVQRRFAPELGSLADIRVHDDAHSAAASSLAQARAFAIGDHVAFGAGTYRPGTPFGDAILAHELAHARGYDDEDAADRIAERATRRLHLEEDAADDDSLPSPRAAGPLKLRRCGGTSDEEGEQEDAGPEIVPDEEVRASGYDLETPGGAVVVGRSYPMRLLSPPVLAGPNHVDPMVFARWHVRRPGGTDALRFDTGTTGALTLDHEGSHTIIVVVPMGPNRVGHLRHQIEARSVGAVASEKLDEVEPISEQAFYVRLAQHQLSLQENVTQEQRFGDAHIELTSGSNPQTASANFPFVPRNEYTARAPDGVTPARYQWVAAPLGAGSWPDERHGQRRGTYEGMSGYDMGTNATARWTISYMTGLVRITCKMFDADGAVVGEASYRQLVQSSADAAASRRFREYATEVTTELREIDGDALFIPGAHVAQETGAVTETSLFFGPAATGGGFILVDATPGVPVRQYRGADFEAIVNGSLNDDNVYPEGTLRLRVPENSFDIAVQDWSLHTEGASFAQRLSTGWGWASLGLAGLGVLATAFGATAPLAPAFFYASAALGAASGIASLVHRSHEVEPSGLDIAIDIAGVVGSMLGMAGAANVLRHGPRIAAATRVGRFVLYTGFATDALGGVLIAAKAAEDLADVLDGDLAPADQTAALVRILGGLLVNGGLLAWGARDLGATRRQLVDLFDARVVARLRGGEIHALSVLEGPALTKLRGASLDDVRTVAGHVLEDPVRAGRLAQRYGDAFTDAARAGHTDLEGIAQALHTGEPTLGGTRGTYGPAVGGAQPTYRQITGQSTAASLAAEVQSAFVGATPARALAEGATLQAVPGSQTDFRIVVPEIPGTRPRMEIPVTIESTAQRPTSVHRGETGPASLSLRSRSGQYSAEVRVHEDLATADVRHAVGHELDEAILIATSGATGSQITTQKRAGLMRAHPRTATQLPATTAHDTAAAREFAQLVPPVASRGAPFEVPPRLRSRALEMGFGSERFLAEKLALLRSVGVDAEMLGRLQTMARGAEFRGLAQSSRLTAAQVTAGVQSTSGRELARLDAEFGSTTLAGEIQHHSGALARHAQQLEGARAIEHVVDRAVGPNTLILDNNVQSPLAALMHGDPWSSLPSHDQGRINRIRDLNGLTELTGDPSQRTLMGILGTEDVTFPSAALAEGARGAMPSTTRSGLALRAGRDSALYDAVLQRLRDVPPIAHGMTPSGAPGVALGGNKGFRDRAIVADALLASATRGATPRFVSGDGNVLKRLFAFNTSPLPTTPFAPPPSPAMVRGPNEALDAFVQRAYPGGFTIEVPIPASSGVPAQTLRMTVVPALE